MQVKLWNDNVHPYSEKFRGVQYTIPPKEFIMMDEDEAEYFHATFTFPVKDSQNRPDPKHFKMLRIELTEEAKAARAQKDGLVCHANGKKAASAEELVALLSNFSHMLADKDTDGEAEVIKKQNKDLKKENKELKTRLELIEEKLGIGTTDAESI